MPSQVVVNRLRLLPHHREIAANRRVVAESARAVATAAIVAAEPAWRIEGHPAGPTMNAARDALARNNVHLSFGQGQQGGWGFGMAVRTYRGDYAPTGQFGWDGGTGTTA